MNVPKKPEVRPVKVIDGCLCDEEKDKAIDNWIDAQEYIEQLRKLLGE